MNSQLWLVALIGALLGGCIGSSPSLTGSDVAPSSEPAPPPTNEDDQIPEPVATESASPASGPQLHLTDCQSAFIHLRTPRGTIQEPRPEPAAWESDDPVEHHIIDAFWCARVGWNHLERGPVGIVIESSSITGVPAKCLGAELGHIRYPHMVYTTDSEVGMRLADALGIEHYDSAIDVALDGAPAAHVSWQPEGFAPSRVTLTTLQGGPARTSTWSDHFMTSNATTTVRLSLESFSTRSNFNTYPGTTEFVEPSIGAHGPAKTYPVTSAQSRSFAASGVITTWQEPMCGS